MKRLIVCLDGTWNKPDQEDKITNVVKIMRALKPHDENGVAQIAFYDKGVGTGGPIDKLRGGAFGRGLEDNIKDGYRFLANNYDKDDEIYLFGFSRGAFTARSLAGFIGWIGLIRKTELHQLGGVWDRYRERPKGEKSAPADLKKMTWEHEVRIKCVGVWDTVGALGIPTKKIAARRLHKKYRFHNTGLGGHIDHAFHALAIDEKRGPFEPTLWSIKEGQSESPERVQQVWFAGVHSDIGGGYKEARLSDISLMWMIQRVRLATGLCFDDAYLNDQDHVSPDPLGVHHDSLGWYLYSKLLPYHRVIGHHVVKISWLARTMRRFHEPRKGYKYVNEMIHRSALERFGKNAPFKKGEETRDVPYTPENLKKAMGKLPVVEDDGSITEPEG